MTQAAVIFLERSGGWATAWRRLSGDSMPLVEARSVDEFRKALATAPRSLAVLEATSTNLETVVELLTEIDRTFPHARAAVVSERSTAGCEPLVREPGAIHLVIGTRRLGPLVRLAARHLARQPLVAAGQEISIVDEIAALLPWPSTQNMTETK